MVLRMMLVALLACGCKQSLFDAHGGRDSGVSDAPVLPATCPTPCLGDAGKDFGTSPWRFVDDHRNRTWAAMTN